MHPRPKLSLNDKQLIPGKKAPSSAHEVIRVAFSDSDSTMKHGFYKPCDDRTYPPLLAKYVVAFSVLVRAALGERASEDRLVYNEMGEVIGTVSIQVPNFTPMLTTLESAPLDPEKQKLVNPDKQILIDKNIAELLISAYKHKNNDLHPGNISVNGLIDWDELYNELTSILKGERFGTGVIIDSPKILCSYNVEDIRTFPIVNKRIHWPSHYKPLNWNLFKAYKTSAFLELEKDETFKKQTYKAILKELLAFDKEMLAARMKLYLGEEKLDLDKLKLSQAKSLAILDFGGKKSEFIEHCLHYLEQEHNNFKNIVLQMPEFQDFLIKLNKNKDEVLELKKWFLAQNINNPVPYSLKFIDQELHEIWRICFKNKFDTHIKNLNDSITTSKILTLDMNNDQSEDINFEQIDHMMLNFNSPADNDSATKYFIVKEETQTEKKLMLDRAIYHKIRKPLLTLYQQISQLTDNYYGITRSKIELKHNYLFLKELLEAIKTFENERIQIKEWLLKDKAEAQKANNRALENALDYHIPKATNLFTNITKITKELHETLTAFCISDTTIEAPESAVSKKPTQYTDFNFDYAFLRNDKTIAEQLGKLLKMWLPHKLNDPLIKDILQRTLKDYRPRSQGKVKGFFIGFFRKREDEIKDEIKKPVPSISNILSHGRWHSTSFNTNLIKKLCITMLVKEKWNPYAEAIYKNICENDSRWWSKIALDIAVRSELVTDNLAPPSQNPSMPSLAVTTRG